MGDVPILSHQESTNWTPAAPQQLADGDYNHSATRGSTQAPIKAQKKQKIVQGGRGSSRTAAVDNS